MEKVKKKILNIIQNKSLSASDVKNWRDVLGTIPEELCVDILKFIESKSDGLNILNSNLNKKIEALNNQDVAKWNEILEEEKKLFSINN